MAAFKMNLSEETPMKDSQTRPQLALNFAPTLHMATLATPRGRAQSSHRSKTYITCLLYLDGGIQDEPFRRSINERFTKWFKSHKTQPQQTQLGVAPNIIYSGPH